MLDISRGRSQGDLNVGFDLDIDLSQEETANIFHLSEERIVELEKIMAHARIDSRSTLEWIKVISAKVETIEELVLVVFMAANNGGK